MACVVREVCVIPCVWCSDMDFNACLIPASDSGSCVDEIVLIMHTYDTMAAKSEECLLVL